MNKKFAIPAVIIAIVLILVAVAGLGSGIYFYTQSQQNADDEEQLTDIGEKALALAKENAVKPSSTYTVDIIGTYIEYMPSTKAYTVYGTVSSISGIIYTDNGKTEWTHKFSKPVPVMGYCPRNSVTGTNTNEKVTLNPSIVLSYTFKYEDGDYVISKCQLTLDYPIFVSEYENKY